MDYATLRLIWWALLGILLIAFAVMDGFDLGSAFLLPLIGRSDVERRVIINTTGPVWEGNQVWFILGGGAIFAAFPALYAASFSGFYLAMFLVLVALILRPGGFKYHSKLENPLWRHIWDWALFVGGLVPALVFGVAFGNLFEGVPFSFDSDLRFHSEITLFGLLNPFALVVGLVSLSMLVLQGAAWLNIKTEGKLQARARLAMVIAGLAFVALFVAAGVWLTQIPALHITAPLDPNGPSNPLLKTVQVGGSWYRNYAAAPALWLAPALAVCGALLALALRKSKHFAFLLSSLAVASTVATAGFALFPFLLPSSLDPSASLLVFDASSSKLTLEIILAAAVIFLPIIIAYTTWVYRVMRGPVTETDILSDSHSVY